MSDMKTLVYPMPGRWRTVACKEGTFLRLKFPDMWIMMSQYHDRVFYNNGYVAYADPFKNEIIPCLGVCWGSTVPKMEKGLRPSDAFWLSRDRAGTWKAYTHVPAYTAATPKDLELMA